MKNINTKHTIVGTVSLGTLIALGIIIFAVLYIASAPFRTKVDRKIEDIATWTPEQIQRNPSGYLRWAEAEVGELQNKIGARRIDLLKQRELARKQGADATAKLSDTTRLLEEAKSIYRNDDWPAQLRGREMSQEEMAELLLLLREQSDLLHSQQKSLSERDQMLNDSLALLGATGFRIDALLVRVQHVTVLQSVSGSEGTDAGIGSQIDELTGTVVALQTVLPGSIMQSLGGHDTAEREARIDAILAE